MVVRVSRMVARAGDMQPGKNQKPGKRCAPTPRLLVHSAFATKISQPFDVVTCRTVAARFGHGEFHKYRSPDRPSPDFSKIETVLTGKKKLF